MSRRAVEASAPGKLILLGEHAVVWGQPALAGAVALHTRVRIEEAEGEPFLDLPIRDARLDLALARILPARVNLRIRSDLPLGRGMGSSASLSLALVRAVALWNGESPCDAQLLERSLELEGVFHGRPSGVDSSVVLGGGLLRFQRLEARAGSPPGELARLDLRPVPSPPLPLVVLDSGQPGDTSAMVARVAARRPGIDPILAQIGQGVDRAIAEIQDIEALGQHMSRNQGWLSEIGVSTPHIDALCAFAEGAGALGAKLSGAGGGGVVIALLQPEHLPAFLARADKAGVRALAPRFPAS